MTLPHPPSELFRKFIHFGGARLPLPRTLWPGLPSSRLQYTYTDGLPAEYCESFSPRPGSIFSLSLTLLTFHPGCLKLFWRQHVWTTAGFSINPLQNWMKWSSLLECIWLELLGRELSLDMYNFYDGGEGVSEERDEIEVDADASVDHHQNGDMMMLDVGCWMCSTISLFTKSIRYHTSGCQ